MPEELTRQDLIYIARALRVAAGVDCRWGIHLIEASLREVRPGASSAGGKGGADREADAISLSH